jgi:hypothetical protein
MNTSESLQDCIMFHKRTVFSADAAEQQKSYMMGSLKKPHGMSIKKHLYRFKNNEWLYKPIAYAARQLTGGHFHRQGKLTIQRCHTGWNCIDHLSH